MGTEAVQSAYYMKLYTVTCTKDACKGRAYVKIGKEAGYHGCRVVRGKTEENSRSPEPKELPR